MTSFHEVALNLLTSNPVRFTFFFFFTVRCSTLATGSLVALEEAPCVPPHRQAGQVAAFGPPPTPVADKGSKAFAAPVVIRHTPWRD